MLPLLTVPTGERTFFDLSKLTRGYQRHAPPETKGWQIFELKSGRTVAKPYYVGITQLPIFM